ncbi:hypothetical protein SFRURICE_009718 [Spodoptera frugiperda]|nr:hypothetical protein SFRURICE_009718 [Spodoptera frugiperda]
MAFLLSIHRILENSYFAAHLHSTSYLHSYIAQYRWESIKICCRHAFYPRQGRQRCTLRHLMPLYNVHKLLTICVKEPCICG